jgi:hypothetical protein
MKSLFFVLGLLLIGACSMYDLYFAVKHIDSFAIWELNPLAVLAYKAGGGFFLVGYKLLTYVFFFVVCTIAYLQGKNVALVAMTIVGMAYSLLMVYYVVYL